MLQCRLLCIHIPMLWYYFRVGSILAKIAKTMKSTPTPKISTLILQYSFTNVTCHLSH